MPRGDKSSYTGKQKRQAEHIEEGYEKRGVALGRGRAARLGHREQGNGRRQEERLGPRQGHGHQPVEKGRQGRRPRIGIPFRRRAFGIGQEGRGHAQAQCIEEVKGAGASMPSDKGGAIPQTWAARYDDRDDEELAARVAARRLAARAGMKQAPTHSPMAEDGAEGPDPRTAGPRAR